jgi:hypothetical protein
LGEENTKFFHATVIVNHSRNCIRFLQDSNGFERFQHEGKASLLWEAFKERLGHTEFS